jgi:hypothetical protein
MGVIKYKIMSHLLLRTCVTRGGQLVKAGPACTSLSTSSLEVLNCAIRSCFPNAQGLDQDRYGLVLGSKNDGGRHKQIRLPLPGWQLFGGATGGGLRALLDSPSARPLPLWAEFHRVPHYVHVTESLLALFRRQVEPLHIYIP